MKFLRLRHLCRAAICVIFLFLPLLAPGAPRVQAQSAPTFEVTAAYEGNYLPDRWLPLSIVLRNDGPPTQVLLAAALPNANYRNTLPLDLAGGSETRATLFVAMDQQARSIRVTLEQAGSVLAEQAVAVRPRVGERTLGIVSPAPVQLNLPRREELTRFPFLSFALNPNALPDRLAGLSSLSLLLLNNVPSEQLRPAQIDALYAWVRSGGHLLIGGGPGAAATLAALPPQLRPAELGGISGLDPAPLGVLVDSSPPDRFEGLALIAAVDATIVGAPDAPLWVARDVGAGRVTQLAFDPGLAVLQAWPGAPLFWDQLLRTPTLVNTSAGPDYSPELIREQTMTVALGNLPAINLPVSEPLFALLALYTILIGPGMALLLRRMDRQSAGWLLLPVVAGIVLAGGSLLALNSRADQRIASEVTLIEQLDADSARVRTALALLSPRDETFTLRLAPSALTRPIQPFTSRYGPVSAAGGDFMQEQGTLELAVDRWAIQGVLIEDTVSLPALDAEIRFSATTIEAIVRNTVGVPLRDVVLAYADQVVYLGDLAADQEAGSTWPLRPAFGQARPDADAPLSLLVLGEELSGGSVAGGQIERRVLIREALLNAAVERGGDLSDPGPLVLAWIDSDPLDLRLEAEGIAAQQISLLVGRARITGSGPVLLPSGWMRLQPAADNRAFCRGAFGRGLQASPAPLTLDLALPADLATLQAREVTIDLQSERPWPNAGAQLAIYNWDQAEWDAIANFDGPGLLFINQRAEQYVDRGRLRIQLDGRIAEAGCVFADVQMSGTLP